MVTPTLKPFPIDIFKAREYGLKRWQNEFYWPVSYAEFKAIEEDVEKVFLDVIEEETDSRASDILLAKYQLFAECASLLHAVAVVQRLQADGMDILYTDDRRFDWEKKKCFYYRGLVEEGRPFDSSWPLKYESTLYDKKSLKGNIVFAWNLFGMFLSLNKAMPLKTFKFGILRRMFIRQMREPVQIIARSDFFKNESGPPPDLISLLKEETIPALVAGLRSAAAKYNIIISDRFALYLNEFIAGQILQSARDYTTVSDNMSRQKPFHLIIESSANYHDRLISIVLRQFGGKVTGMVHGNQVYIFEYHNPSWMELSTVDMFVTYTKESKALIEGIIRSHPPLKGNKVDIIPENNPLFMSLYDRKKCLKLPERVRTVMLISGVFRGDLRYNFRLTDMVRLDVELRTIELLNKNGYRVLYKKHPHGVLMDERIESFLPEGVEVVYQPFEKIRIEPDAYLFYATVTRVFYDTLCSNRPVIFLDPGMETWQEEPYSLLSRRCRIVPAFFDKRNRIMFDEAQLEDALAKKPEPPDMAFLKKYMFP